MKATKLKSLLATTLLALLFLILGWLFFQAFDRLMKFGSFTLEQGLLFIRLWRSLGAW
jgi:hypothetical protein